jgi:hypothetical protein
MGEANVSESLAVLRGPASAVTEGILNGDYALWLGSGISFGRMPGLSELIFLLLKALWDKSPDPASPYRLKFDGIVAKFAGGFGLMHIVLAENKPTVLEPGHYSADITSQDQPCADGGRAARLRRC